MYYLLGGSHNPVGTYVEAINQTEDSLLLGKELELEYEDLPYIYNYTPHSEAPNSLPHFFGSDCIMSKKMYKVITDTGVTNIQALPLEFINKMTGEKRSDYIVINFTGGLVPEGKFNLIKSGDLKKSVSDINNGLLIFRLDKTFTLIASAKVIEDLKEHNITGISYSPIENT